LTHLNKLVLLTVIVCLAACPALAGMKDIRIEALPQDKGVRDACANVLKLEYMVSSWSPEWRYETPKEEVASTLKESLGTLKAAMANAPDNKELMLLTGLVAHYAYNVDVDGSFELAKELLTNAEMADHGDYRAEWFLAAHLCQANLPKEGMEKFLTVEARTAPTTLAAGFWDDYMACATIDSMPAHALRAGKMIVELRAEGSTYRDALLDINRRRYKEPDAKATYDFKDVWRMSDVGGNTAYTNFLCGFSFVPNNAWKLSLPDFRNGMCAAQVQTGAHRGRTGSVFSNVLVLARQPKPGESLENFVKSLLPLGTAKPAALIACPTDTCVSFEAFDPETYKQEGGGHAIVTAFQRNAPEFPGFIFEQPAPLPSSEPGKTAYFHPLERFRRLDGKMYYFVLLDSASSVLDKAKTDYEDFLKSMRIE
jgi:hypothetical protein